jgi:hypothetical protein
MQICYWFTQNWWFCLQVLNFRILVLIRKSFTLQGTISLIHISLNATKKKL